jgi:hypothetical protein
MITISATSENLKKKKKKKPCPTQDGQLKCNLYLALGADL